MQYKNTEQYNLAIFIFFFLFLLSYTSSSILSFFSIFSNCWYIFCNNLYCQQYFDCSNLLLFSTACICYIYNCLFLFLTIQNLLFLSSACICYIYNCLFLLSTIQILLFLSLACICYIYNCLFMFLNNCYIYIIYFLFYSVITAILVFYYYTVINILSLQLIYNLDYNLYFNNILICTTSFVPNYCYNWNYYFLKK